MHPRMNVILGADTSVLLFASVSARADLAAKFAEELALDPDKTPITREVREKVQAMPIVMIAGMLNESVPEYFEDNVDSLYRDFDQQQVRRFYPSSGKTMKENAPLVAAWIHQSWEDYGRKPLMIVSHSKGAAE